MVLILFRHFLLSFDNRYKHKFKSAHKHCFNNRNEILGSEVCGCFYCLKIFPPTEINSWLEERAEKMVTTSYSALCPYCNIDSVLGSRSGYQIDNLFLSQMNKAWFAIDDSDEPDVQY